MLSKKTVSLRNGSSYDLDTPTVSCLSLKCLWCGHSCLRVDMRRLPGLGLCLHPPHNRGAGIPRAPGRPARTYCDRLPVKILRDPITKIGNKNRTQYP